MAIFRTTSQQMRLVISMLLSALLLSSLTTNSKAIADSKQAQAMPATDMADLGQVMYINGIQTHEDLLKDSNPASITRLPDNKWQKSSTGQVNLGYTTSKIWLKFNLTNSHSDTIHALLDINFPLFDHIQIYRLDSHNPTPTLLLQTGDTHNFTDRIIEHPNFVLPIRLAPSDLHTYFVMIQSTTAIQTQILLWDPQHFYTHYRHSTSLNFFYFGLLLATALFNFLMFVSLRERVYGYYSLYATCLALFIAAQQGILFELFFYDNPSIHNWSQLIIISIASTCSALFTREFLQLRQHKWPHIYLTHIAKLPIPLLLLSSLSGHGVAIQISMIMNFFILCFCYGIGLKQLVAKRRNAAAFVLAWSFLFAGGAVYTLAKVGVLPFNAITSSALQTGSVLELLILAIALAKYMHTQRESRLKAQQVLVEKSAMNAQLQTELIYSSTHSKVSGLPNRTFMEGWLDNYLRHHKETPCTLVFVYFSRLHEVSRTLGRDTGEKALKTFATKLNELAASLPNLVAVQPEEGFNIGSMEGATHALLLSSSPDHDLVAQISAVQRALNKPISINDIQVEPGVQVSLVGSPEYGNQASQLIRHGSIALDAARENKLQLSIYSANIDPYSERRLALMSELRKALQENQLTLYYQPIIHVRSQAIIGAEALIRWPHPSHGLIMPDEFISIAEQTGLIHDLSIWVFQAALAQLNAWLKTHPDFLLSINVSATNLMERHFIEVVNRELGKQPKLADNLIFELTESQMMKETQFALDNLWALSELGVQIAIDDFGTGYSSLSYLRKLPANKLKIDKSFVLQLEDDKQNQVIVQTAIDMAHNLGLQVVAEGVESERARALLDEMNCDLCQGFHFSRPIPLTDFEKLLNKENP